MSLTQTLDVATRGHTLNEPHANIRGSHRCYTLHEPHTNTRGSHMGHTLHEPHTNTRGSYKGPYFEEIIYCVVTRDVTLPINIK